MLESYFLQQHKGGFDRRYMLHRSQLSIEDIKTTWNQSVQTNLWYLQYIFNKYCVIMSLGPTVWENHGAKWANINICDRCCITFFYFYCEPCWRDFRFWVNHSAHLMLPLWCSHSSCWIFYLFYIIIFKPGFCRILGFLQSLAQAPWAVKEEPGFWWCLNSTRANVTWKCQQHDINDLLICL